MLRIFVLILFIPLLVWYHWQFLPVILHWCMYICWIKCHSLGFSGPVLNSVGPHTGETGSKNFKFRSGSYSLHLFAIQYTMITSFFYCLSCCTVPEFCRQWWLLVSCRIAYCWWAVTWLRWLIAGLWPPSPGF
jgi:hypothetical protein